MKRLLLASVVGAIALGLVMAAYRLTHRALLVIDGTLRVQGLEGRDHPRSLGIAHIFADRDQPRRSTGFSSGVSSVGSAVARSPPARSASWAQKHQSDESWSEPYTIDGTPRVGADTLGVQFTGLLLQRPAVGLPAPDSGRPLSRSP